MNKHQDPTGFEESPRLDGTDGVAMIQTSRLKREQDHWFVINSYVSMFEPAARQQRLDALQQLHEPRHYGPSERHAQRGRGRREDYPLASDADGVRGLPQDRRTYRSSSSGVRHHEGLKEPPL